jgi:SET domain-containing protein
VASASFVGFLHLFNHACCPNAAFDSAAPVLPADLDAAAPPSYSIVAMEPIPAGAQICISYACSAVGPTVRSAFLLDEYGFTCWCRRCECDDPLDEIRRGAHSTAARNPLK